MFDCMDDCIHLRACRRVQKIAKQKYKGLCIPRNCNEECTAYQSEKELVKDIEESIIWAFEQGQDGMDYISIDSSKLFKYED